MWRNNPISLILFAGLNSCPGIINAQDGLLTIDQNALVAGQATTVVSGYSLTNNGPVSKRQVTIMGKQDPTETASGSSIPIGNFTAALLHGTIWEPPVTLINNTPQTISSGGSFTSGPFSMRYTAPNLAAYAWLAAYYSTTLIFGVLYNSKAQVLPGEVSFSINVPAFIAEKMDPGSITLDVNSLSFFRNQTISTTQSLPLWHTVPIKLALSSTSSLLDFSGGYAGVNDPHTNANKILVQRILPSEGSLSLSTTPQVCVTNAAVGIGNSTDVSLQFSISSAGLKTGFANMGNYATTLTLGGSNADISGPATTYTKSVNLKVTVSDLAELNVTSNQIDMTLQSAADYKNGVVVDKPNHLQVSKTTPFDISVKAGNQNFISPSGDLLPVSIMSVGPTTPQTNVNTVPLSATNQLLINGWSATIDQFFDIRYQIPPSQTHNLLNKKADVYSGTVIYTLTAH